MIANKKEFFGGVAMMVGFVVVLIIMFGPGTVIIIRCIRDMNPSVTRSG